ncbi:cytochrome P450 2F2-like [Acanthochromis polyacanthus]|uniref:cytochrome P450 2F2-like n=1 Tax=Acanthochromis polyacanthus TaxID=80966 RepID=UPI002234AC2F|nr:cytochrome P450 2F2-like [Acanthochromis polyacanthus]
MDFSSTLLLFGLIFALLRLLSLKSRRRWSLPPGPPGLPLIGNLLQLDKRAPFTSLLKLSETYGPVMTVYLGPQRAVFLVGYETVKEALVDRAEDFTGRGPVPFLIRVTRGYGLAVSNGERWRQLRRFTLSTLRDFGMGRKGMEEWIQEESQHLVNRIKNTNAAPFDPTFFLSCSASNVICCMVFGQRFSYDDKDFLDLLHIISEAIRFASSPWGQLYNIFPRLMERLPGRQHKVFADIEKLRQFTMTKIQEHQDTLDVSSPRDYIDCFLTRLSQEKDIPTTEFHYDNLVSTVLNLYQAGTESSSSTIRYALNLLIKYPKIQETMQQEIDTVVGHKRCPYMEDRKSLPFTDAVIHEIQRCMDIVPLGVPHYALQDISFRGYTLPKGTLIFPMLHSVLKEEKQWATPWTFNPQHFLDQNGNFKKNPAFLPFSAGKRSCAGEALARMEIFLFMVSLLQNFTFSCSEGPDSIDLSAEYSSFANLPRRYMIIATPRC